MRTDDPGGHPAPGARSPAARQAESETAGAAPKNGLLSGMILTWSAAGAAVFIGIALPSLHPIFAAKPSGHLADLLAVSVGLMALHKLESYWTGEFVQCPVYRTMGRARWARDVRAAIFVVFCSGVVLFMTLIALVLRGPPWPLLLLAVWVAQGLHELHHLAKSVARRGYYPGTATALVFVLFIDAAFLPAWYAELAVATRLPMLGLYAVQLPLLLAFFVEDRRWLARESAPERAGRAGREPVSPGARPAA